MVSIRDVFVRLGIKTDPKGFAVAQQGINKIKGSAITLGRVLMTGAIAMGVKKMIETASDIEETANKFGAVFGGAGDSVQKSLDDIAKRTGATGMELQAMASNIGALIKPSLGSAEAAGKMAASISEMALDIASFNNVSSDDAIVALRSGLIGSAEPLQRYGVDVRNSALELEAMRQGMNQSFDSMTAGQKIMLRHAAIQRQLGEQGAAGDATKTAKGFANATRNLGKAISETAGIIGTFFLNSAGNLVNKVRALVDSFQKWIFANRKLIQQGVDKFLDRAKRVITAVYVVSKRVVEATIDWINHLSPLGKQLLKIATIAAAIAVVMLLPGGSILLLMALIGLLIEDFEVWRNGGESVIGDLLGGFGTLTEKLKEYRDLFSAWVRDHQTGITLVSSMVSALALVIGVSLIKANIAAIASFITLKGVAIAAAISSAWAWLAVTAPLVLTAALLTAIIGTIVFLGAELVKLALGHENFFSTMATGISELIDEYGGILPAIDDMLTYAAKSFLKFFGMTEEKAKESVEKIKNTFDFSGWFFDDEDEVNKKAEELAKKAAERRKQGRTETVAAPVDAATIAAQKITSPAINTVTAPAGASGGVVVTNRNQTNVNVEVKAAPGMDTKQLAEEVAEKTIKKLGDAELRQAALNFQTQVAT